MKLKNKLLLILILTLLSIQSKAQSQVWSDNLMKYWYYRDRLEYFVMPGTKAGQSLVADIRNQPDNGQDRIRFGQQYTRMGFYLGMLATEYRLLKDNGQMHDLPSIVQEIELALNALIRTDMHESGPPWSYLGITQDYLDGFFVREDVPPFFNSQYNTEDYLLHFNKDLPEDNIVDLLQQGYFGKPAKISYNKVKCINALFNEDNPVNQYYNYEGKWTLNEHDNIIAGIIDPDNNWQYGVGVGLHQLPFMKGESIEDKSLDVGWSIGIITERIFRKNKTYSIGFNIFNYSEKNKFCFLPSYRLNDESVIKEKISIKTHRNILKTGIDFKYYFLKNKLFVGGALDIFSTILKKHSPYYDAQFFEKYLLCVDDYFLNGYLKPHLVFGRDFDFNTLNGRIQFTLGGNYLYMEPQKDVFIYSFDPNLTPVFSYPKEGFLEVGLSVFILLNVN